MIKKDKASESLKLDTQYTNNIICPCCGHEDKDSWEINFGSNMEDETEIICDECDEEFIATRIVDISYSTRKIDNFHILAKIRGT